MQDVINLGDYLKFVLALMLVIGLIVALGFALRRFGQGFPGNLKRGRRLHLVETLPLDAKHRLILVCRDGVEHLVVTGPGGVSLVESNINSSTDAAIPGSSTDETIPDGTRPGGTRPGGTRPNSARPQNAPPFTSDTRFKDLLTMMKSSRK